MNKKDVRILIGCEESGTIRDAFHSLGFTGARSCDVVEDRNNSEFHIIQDVREVIYQGWDMAILHPPCTHLANSGAKHFKKKRKLGKQQAAIDFVKLLLNAPIRHIALENPVGVLSTEIRKPDQIVQPWHFGDEFQKTTCWWLKNLPRLKYTKIVGKGEFVTTPSGKRLPKWYSDNKSSKNRSKTFPGMAMAIAKQWGEFLMDENTGFELKVSK